MSSCKIAKTMVHRWEEPPISGTNGSGAVFFAGCNLRCVFCQNHVVSQQGNWPEVTVPQLVEVFFSLAGQGVHNINLITPTLHVPAIAEAIKKAKQQGLGLPFIYNSSAYESVFTLQKLDGLIDIYLPDLKYFDDAAAQKYSGAKRYFEIATAAILEMQRQVGMYRVDTDGIMRRGIIIRHLVLPGQRKDSFKLLDWIAANIPEVQVSLMAQYVPTHRAGEFPEINRRITTFEYQSVVGHAVKLGLTNGFTQSRAAATHDCIPDFANDTRKEGRGQASCMQISE